MSEDFRYDVFLSHSKKDKQIVRDIAERLKKDGVKVWFDEWELKPGDSIPSKIEEGLESSRVLVLCMSANAFGSDWTQLEAGTFRFRDPLNKDRRFIPLRLDDATIKGSLGQFLYINWGLEHRDKEYSNLVDACVLFKGESLLCANDGLLERTTTIASPSRGNSGRKLRFALTGHQDLITRIAWSVDGHRIASASRDYSVKIWDADLGILLHTFRDHESAVHTVAWAPNGEQLVSGSTDGQIRLWNTTTGEMIGEGWEGHTDRVFRVIWSHDGEMIASASADNTIRLWNAKTGTQIGIRIAHFAGVNDLVWCPLGNKTLLVSGSFDQHMRLWDPSNLTEKWPCLWDAHAHSDSIACLALSWNRRWIASAGDDATIRISNSSDGSLVIILEWHTAEVSAVSFSFDDKLLASKSQDGKILVWRTDTWMPVDQFDEPSGGSFESGLAFHPTEPILATLGEKDSVIRIWELNPIELLSKASPVDGSFYVNAKVLLVGDTSAGKTGLTHRLATGEWKPSESSTVGAWSTQWQLKDASAEPGVDRELWLWDFGGQADQRLIHQLYMDRTALILLMFNADQEDVLPSLRDWQTALRRCVKDEIPYFLVAGRIDTGFKASRGKLQAFAKEQGLAYHETSAKSGEGCDELRAAMITGIPWAQMEKRTSPRIFKLIKDEILKLRDEGQVLHTFKELRELLWQRLPDEPRFTDETLQTVIGLLDGPGVVKELDYGTYVLLAPEWINAYAQAVIRTLRSAENDLGVLPLRSIAEGKLIYQSIGRDGAPAEMKRLPPAEERVVLGEMERQLEQRYLCLRQGDQLVFPSHCGRDRPAVLEHPSVFVSYAVKGFLDDIYATLVVKLAVSESFKLAELWRDAADFVTLAGEYHMGVKLTRESGSQGEIGVYFGKGVAQQEQVIFANYIHRHLEGTCEQAVRLRHYICPKCHTPKGNLDVLMKKLLVKKQQADTECDGCGERFPLWDGLEKRFASEAARKQVEELQADDCAQLTTRRKGKLLVLDVGARITSANQKWMEIPGDEDDGIDMQVEFTDEVGNGVGKGLCLQLKAGNSFLKKRQTDGVEIFTIKKQRWVKTWINQPYPVMLVIGTFSEEDERSAGKEKVEFAAVRWMEISSVLRHESANGTKPVKQIEFKGERLDITSVRKWREKALILGTA
ncbi:MAG: TIR domain-containing protein [Luteolibacter sp.]|uniref:TIR domain-containing protein n=1 Tax=Luteolibacter sp. TaxID=1962973 RepID=UPI003267E101